jgi:tetratricopeptide (TPR) repeat protein
LLQLAQIMAWKANYAEAEKLTREATSIYHATLPDKHPDRVSADLDLGDLLYRIGNLGEALVLVRKVVEDQKDLFGTSNVRMMSTYDTLSKIEIALKQWDAAEKDARTGLAIAISALGKTNFNVGISHSSVANVLLKRKKYDEAEKEAHVSLTILQETASPDHQYTASAEYLLASALNGQHRFKEAEPMLRENMARWNRAQAPAWRTARTESALGVALLQLKKQPEAKQALMHAYEVLSAKDSGADADTIAVAKLRVDEYQHCVAEHRENSCSLSE